MRYHKIINMEIPKTTFQAKMIVGCGKRPSLISKPKAREAKQKTYYNLLKNRPPKTLKGPYHLALYFYFQAPKSRIKKCKGLQPMIVRPDLDNLIKGFQDAMVDAGWIENDQQVYALDLRKYETIKLDYVSVTIF